MDENKAGSLQTSIANKLEAGAEALRLRTQAAAPGPDGAAAAPDQRLATVTDTVASGMSGTARLIRDADVEQIKSTIETQVREHPVRTLLVALGAGYLLGKALRR